MDPHTRSAIPAPKTPQENARRLAADRAATGNLRPANRRGADPDRKQRPGNRAFVRKDGDAR